jgi:hypothetical protein
VLWLLISVPLMVLALAIAVLPVLLGSVAESRDHRRPLATAPSRPSTAGAPPEVQEVAEAA